MSKREVMSKIEIVEKSDPELVRFLDERIAEYNWQHWEVSQRLPLAVQLKNDQGEIIAGCSGRTFGNWLQINTLWVCESLRGQSIGKELLELMESQAVKRGCNRAILDTLNFQAEPFYRKLGYKTEWVQEDYPRTGCKFFMTKRLVE
jgi:GNAT superfamily N-acetyltransferase